MLLAVLLLALPQVREAVPVPAPETFPVEVDFRAQETWRAEAAAVPGISVEVGVDRPGSSPCFVDSPVLARFLSDERGRIRGTLDVPLAWKQDARARLWARVETPGYARNTAERSTAGGLEPTVLVARTGRTLFGVVRASDGEPVEDAEVWLDDAVYARCATTLAGGRFALHVPGAGLHRLHARAVGVGSSTIQVREPGPLAQIVLSGGGLLSGVVLDPSGEPVRGLRLWIVPVGFDCLPRAAVFVEAERNGGTFGGEAATGEAGEFALPALVPGEYRVFGSWTRPTSFPWRASQGFQELLGTVRVDGAGERSRGVELRSRQHRIEVHLVDERGRPVDVWSLGKDGERRTGLRLGAGDGRLQFGSGFLATGHAAVRAVEEDREYVVSLQDERFVYQEMRIDVPFGRFRAPVTFVVGAPATPARLAIRVLDPYGADFERPWITLRSAESGREVDSSVRSGLPPRSLTTGSRWSVTVPPGRFIVEASSEPLLGCVIPELYPRTPHLPAEVEVLLRAGEVAEVVLRLGAAGAVDLEPTVSPEPRLSPLDAFRLGSEGCRQRLGGRVVELVSARGELLPVEFQNLGLDRSGVPWIVPGYSARGLTPIPPGRWLLRALGEDGSPVLERWIEIVAGDVTRVPW